MSNVIQFPGNTERDWRIIEAQIKHALVDVSVPVQERLLDRLKPFCEALAVGGSNFSISFDFHGPMPKARADAICADIGEKVSKLLSDKIADLVVRVIAERTYREIEGCREAGLL